MKYDIEEKSLEELENVVGGADSFADMTKEEKEQEQLRLELISYRHDGMKLKTALRFFKLTRPNILPEEELDALIREIWNSSSFAY